MAILLEKLVNESIQIRNSLDGDIGNSGFFRKVSSYLGRIGYTITKYRKPSERVTAAVILLLSTSPRINNANAKVLYVKPAQGVKYSINDVVNNEIRVPEDYKSIQAAIDAVEALRQVA